MFSEENGPKIGLKISCLILITLMIGIGLAAIVPVVEESEGWEEYTSARQYSYGYYGRVTRSYSSSSGNTYSIYSGSQITIGRSYNSPYTYYYKGFMGFPISGLDVDTFVNSGSISFYAGRLYGSPSACDFTTRLYLMDADPTISSAEDTYFGISPGGTYIGSQRITSVGVKTVQISSAGIDKINEKIENGDDFLFIGFDYYNAYYNYEYFYMYANDARNTINLDIDREAPVIDSISEPDEFINSTSLEVSTTAHDLPVSPNTGIEEYQVGFFLDETSEEPYDLQLWSDSSSAELTGLDNAEQYFIRTRAKDGAGYISDWSDCINTTIDLSAPSIPVLEPETEYSEGTSLTVDWSDSIDAGIGLDMYELHRSTDPVFSAYDTYYFEPGVTTKTFDDLLNGEEYHFRVRANDSFNQISDFSPTVSTTMDDQAPTVPVMMTEPIFTKGLENTFQWHPAVDNGVGLDHYQVQLAYVETFNPGEIQEDITTDQTLSTFTELNDGDTYYVRVRAIDEFDHMSDWSSMEWSIQDDTGPGEPGLLSLMEYQMDGAVQLEWEGAIDDGVGVGWYMVEWSEDMIFVEEVMVKDHILGQSMTILDLETDVSYYFKVTSFDSHGNTGPSETTMTTLDSNPPSLPIIEPMEAYIGGSNNTVAWSAAMDDVSGLDHYLLEVFIDEAAITKYFEIHTTDIEFEVNGLTGGQIYFYRVTAFDVAGNSVSSGIRFSTQDTMAPTIQLDMGDLFGSNDPTIGGMVYDEGSGVASVEITSNDGETWDDCPLSSDEWTYAMSNIPPGTTIAWVRTTDNGGNTGPMIPIDIDNVAPIIEVTSPPAGKKITGPTQITGRIIDPHLASYSVDYRLSGTEVWNSIVPEQFTSDFSGVMGTWLPAGLPDGDYFIKVTATDSLEQTSEIVFNLTLEQASISIGPSSITFSDVDPLLGETVTVSVMVSNLGGSDAEDVTVTIYDNGEEIKTITGQTVPSMGVIYVEVELPVSAYHNITARATSDRYDTGEMTTASKLVAEIPEPEEEPPEESFLEDSAGILGLLALIIGILAIIIAIILGVLLSKRKPVEAKEAEVKEPEGPPGMPAAPDVPTLPEAGATSQELTSTQPAQTPRPSLPPSQAPAQPAPTPAPVPAPVQEPAPAPAEPEFQAPSSAAPVHQVEAPMQAAPQPNVQLPQQ